MKNWKYNHLSVTVTGAVTTLLENPSKFVIINLLNFKPFLSVFFSQFFFSVVQKQFKEKSCCPSGWLIKFCTTSRFWASEYTTSHRHCAIGKKKKKNQQFLKERIEAILNDSFAILTDNSGFQDYFLFCFFFFCCNKQRQRREEGKKKEKEKQNNLK